MAFASATDLPTSDLSHVFSSMAHIVFPTGETMSSPTGEFIFYPPGSTINGMRTIDETRRVRLRMLVEEVGSMADLCQELGYARNETATLTRILNANVRHDRDGKPYNMGDVMARYIEEKRGLPRGWMDTPPTYAELDPDPRIAALINVARQLVQENRPEDLDHLVRVGHTYVEPHPKAANGG